MNDLTLYGDPLSGNCLKPKFVADLLGIPYAWHSIDVAAGGAKSDQFLKINPLGKVPVARFSDGKTLIESNAIMLYLAEGHGSNTLVPEDGFARAQMMSWLFWEQYSHEPYIAVRRFQKRFLQTPEADLDPKLLDRGNAALATLSLQLTHSDYLVGKSLTLADIALVAYTRWADEGGFDVNQFEGVFEWVTRVEADLSLR